MDCNMPNMDGFTATEILKSKMGNNMLPWTPIVAVTAYNTSTIEANCKKSGMDDFLPKPCLKSDFDAMLLKWIALLSNS